MSSIFTMSDTVNTLKAIFERHQNERVIVLGTTCVGKTTLLDYLPEAVDMDDIAFADITEEESGIIHQTPWTKEVGDMVDRLVWRNVKVRKGQPAFGTVIIDCEVVIYLDIADELLAEHCNKRGSILADALNMKRAIEEDCSDHKKRNEKVFYYVAMAE